MVESDVVTRKNVLGGVLKPCCYAPVTGYFRDGYCRTDADDFGRHVICAQMTDVFLSCLLYTSPSPRDATLSRMPSSA